MRRPAIVSLLSWLGFLRATSALVTTFAELQAQIINAGGGGSGGGGAAVVIDIAPLAVLNVSSAVVIGSTMDVTIRSSGPESATLDGKFLGRIFDVQGRLVLQNVILTRGMVFGYESGGIVRMSGANARVTIEDSHVLYGVAFMGGGISVEGGAALTVLRTTVEQCSVQFPYTAGQSANLLQSSPNATEGARGGCIHFKQGTLNLTSTNLLSCSATAEDNAIVSGGGLAIGGGTDDSVGVPTATLSDVVIEMCDIRHLRRLNLLALAKRGGQDVAPAARASSAAATPRDDR